MKRFASRFRESSKSKGVERSSFEQTGARKEQVGNGNEGTDSVGAHLLQESTPRYTWREKGKDPVRGPADEMPNDDDDDAGSGVEFLESIDEVVIWDSRTEITDNPLAVPRLTEAEIRNLGKMWDEGRNLYEKNLERGISYEETGQL
jgi:hypothetical protein